MKGYTLAALRRYAAKIEKQADAFGLDHFPQEFNIVSEEEAKQCLAYLGVLPRYRHWSFGKAYDRLDTLYRYSISTSLPYELVINASPSRAWLLEGNNLVMQLIVIAHVFGHNNFFKNNYLFRNTSPETVHDRFRDHAERIEDLIRVAGEEEVEEYLTAAHSIRNQRISVPGLEGHMQGFYLLRFLRDEHPRLEDWQREILDIVDDEWEHFVPHLETKIMNEGWAAWWHRELFKGLKLPHSMNLEFFDFNSSIVFGMLDWSVNPYFIGFSIFDDIKTRWDRMARGEMKEGEEWDGRTGTEKMFEVMRTTKDVDFIEMYLTEELVSKCDLMVWERVTDTDIKVTATAEAGDWKIIRDTLAKNVGLRAFPVIHVVDKNWQRRGELYLKHEDDGRNLKQDYAQGTLRHLFHLWGKPVHLETTTYTKRSPYRYSYDGRTHRQGRIKDQTQWRGPDWDELMRNAPRMF